MSPSRTSVCVIHSSTLLTLVTFERHAQDEVSHPRHLVSATLTTGLLVGAATSRSYFSILASMAVCARGGCGLQHASTSAKRTLRALLRLRFSLLCACPPTRPAGFFTQSPSSPLRMVSCFTPPRLGTGAASQMALLTSSGAPGHRPQRRRDIGPAGAPGDLISLFQSSPALEQSEACTSSAQR